ncbi:MAG: hypothetical protein HKN26_15585, partial [Acidimicrobiales bacterium]|nr:hypothetical protein [Acidimicrobiales bacterium]
VQPFDRRGDEVVVYGLGNFLSNQSANCCIASTQDGMIAMLRIEEQPAGGFLVAESTYVATWVDRSDYTIIPVNETLAAGATLDGSPISADLRSVLQTSRGRTQSAVTALGADGWGARPADNTWSLPD